MAYKLIAANQRVRNKLSGINSVLEEIGQGEVEDQIQDALESAQAEFEERTHVWVWARKVKTYPAQSDVLGTDYDVQEDALDFYTTSDRMASYFALPHRPLTSVQRLAIEYSATQNLITYPANWMRVNHSMGVIMIVPPLGTGSIAAPTGAEQFLPLLRSNFRDAGPLMVSVDYIAGIADADTNPQYSRARDCICKMAAAEIRQNNAGLIANSVGRDGATASFDNNMEQIKLFTDQAAEYMEHFKNQYCGTRMQIV